MKNYDIIIIGNGMVGASVAAALASHDWRVAIIDKQAPCLTQTEQVDLDGRKIALSFGSQQILQAFGVWSQLEPYATPIAQVHISAEGQFGASRINAVDIGQEALGFVLPAIKLNLGLQQSLAHFNNIDFYCPATLDAINLADNSVTVNNETLIAKLIVGADGVMSTSRALLNIETETTDYQQTALVSSVQLERPHHNIAYQRFSDMGTLALLPMKNNTCGFVCTANNNSIERLMALDDAELLTEIQNHFGYRLGQLQSLGKRFTYPVKKIIAKQQVQKNFLLLGNAAHNISPVAAQGFNLALQDVYCLVQLLLKEASNIANILQQYVTARAPEQQRIIKLTDHLITMNDYNRVSSALIGFGLGAFDLVNKKSFAEKAAGISAQIKQLMRAIP